ncbi:MAG TPA: protoporphyrinogen oxidase, partial [Afifellaceae bacterium]|nr:protoporphyrinogen oxidase [Afifellaceae bacterium]
DAQRCDLGPDVRYRYLTGNGHLHSIAAHPLGFFASGYLSRRARLRMLGEMIVPRLHDGTEETVAEFCSRRFGAEFSERVIDPLVGGLFAGKAGELSMSAVFPALMEMEQRHGSVTRGVVHSLFSKGHMPGRRLYSWRDGIATLPKYLAAGLGPAIRTGVTVRRIKAASGGFCIKAGKAGTVNAKTVVVATQPHVAASLLEGLDPIASDAAGAIAAPPLSVVFLGYRRAQIGHPLDGLGYLTPSGENRALSGALFCSTLFPGRAPEGHVSIAGYLGGTRAPDLAGLMPEKLIAIAQSEFRDLLGAGGQPVVARVRQWPRGIPQYTRGHCRRVASLCSTDDRQPGLFVTGNYLTGPGIATCIAQASETASRVRQFLAGHASESLRHVGAG